MFSLKLVSLFYTYTLLLDILTMLTRMTATSSVVINRSTFGQKPETKSAEPMTDKQKLLQIERIIIPNFQRAIENGSAEDSAAARNNLAFARQVIKYLTR